MTNSRFSEYTTSGAFSLTLTRNQVSSLGLVEGGSPDYTANYMAALERKGLCERLAAPTDYAPDRIEFRPTLAGLLTAALCREAGLTNGPPDPVGEELFSLRAELETARKKAVEARLCAKSAMARRDQFEEELHNEQARAKGERMKLFIRVRDPRPEMPDAELRERIGETA
jgi:hypothetical protein